jgi:hypothetical protein
LLASSGQVGLGMTFLTFTGLFDYATDIPRTR